MQETVSPLFAAAWLKTKALRVLWLLLMVLLTTQALAQATSPRRVAFLIGNAAYQNESRLANPHNDVALLARTFRQDLKFDEVLEYRDLTRRELVELVRAVRLKASGADAVFVYYSGHGMQGPHGNYLIPVDARIQNEDHVASEGVNARDFVEALRSAAPRVAVLVLDACRDSPYTRRTRSAVRGLSRMQVSDGNLLVAYATVEGTTADDGTTGNSPYAQALAQHLRQTELPLLAKFDAVRRTTMELTSSRQRPTREGDLEVGVYLTSPSATLSATVRQGFEDASWALCLNSRTALPCREYLKAWPGGRFAPLARTRIADFDLAPTVSTQGSNTPRSTEIDDYLFRGGKSK